MEKKTEKKVMKKMGIGDVLNQKVKNLTEELTFLNKKLIVSKQQTEDITQNMLRIDGAITEFKKTIEELSRDSMTNKTKPKEKNQNEKENRKSRN